jgi:hypothetical protein
MSTIPARVASASEAGLLSEEEKRVLVGVQLCPSGVAFFGVWVQLDMLKSKTKRNPAKILYNNICQM